GRGGGPRGARDSRRPAHGVPGRHRQVRPHGRGLRRVRGRGPRRAHGRPRARRQPGGHLGQPGRGGDGRPGRREGDRERGQPAPGKRGRVVVAHGKSDDEAVRSTHNTARFFTETRHISWVLLIFTVAWGVYGFLSMPQRKDPDIPVRDAIAVCSWPGASAEKIEQLVTRRIEEKIAENSKIERITSNTRTSVT